MTNIERKCNITDLDETINTLLRQCNHLWLKIYNQLTGKNCDVHDIGFINDYAKEYVDPKYHGIIETLLDDMWVVLIKNGISFEEETVEMKLASKKNLEDLLAELKIIDGQLNA